LVTEFEGEVANTSFATVVLATVKVALGATGSVRELSVAVNWKVPGVVAVILQLLKVAEPPVAPLGLALQLPIVPTPVPAPVLTAIVMLSVAPVFPFGMMFPPASSTATTGWVGNAVPLVDAPGDVVKTNWAGGPTEIVKDALVVVSVPVDSTSVAVRVYVPIVLTEHPAKLATPPVTVNGFVAHVRVADPPVTAKVICDVVSLVTTLPPASSTVICGCPAAANAVPPVALPGCCVNEIWLGGPVVMVNGLLNRKYVGP
jgi:hypothetical protein